MRERFELDNGMIVILDNCTEGDVFMRLCTKAGIAHEPEDKAELAHLVEHLMVFGSSFRQDHLTIHEDLASARAELNGDRRLFYQTFECSMSPSFLPEMLQIIYDKIITRTASFDEFESRKKEVLKELWERQGNSVHRTDDMLDQALLWKHGVKSFFERIDNLSMLTRQDVDNFKQKYFVPNNMILIFSGKFDNKRVRQKVNNIFGNLQARYVPELEQKEFTNVKSVVKEAQYATPLVYVNSGKFCNGPANKEYVVLKVISSILKNEGPACRLFREIRDKRGLCYEIDTTLAPYTKENAVFSWSSEGCFQDELCELQSIVQTQIEDLASTIISTHELKCALEYLKSELSAEEGDADKYIDNILTAELFGAKTYSQYRKALPRVERNDIQNAARLLLNDYTTALLVPG